MSTRFNLARLAICQAETLFEEGYALAAAMTARVALEHHVNALGLIYGVGARCRFASEVAGRLAAMEAIPLEKAKLMRKLLRESSKAAHGQNLGVERTAELLHGVRQVIYAGGGVVD